MSDLDIVSNEAAYHMEKIQKLFKSGAKITLIVRPPQYKVEGDTDFVMTDDDIDKAIAVLERRKNKDDESSRES